MHLDVVRVHYFLPSFPHAVATSRCLPYSLPGTPAATRVLEVGGCQPGIVPQRLQRLMPQQLLERPIRRSPAPRSKIVGPRSCNGETGPCVFGCATGSTGRGPGAVDKGATAPSVRICSAGRGWAIFSVRGTNMSNPSAAGEKGRGKRESLSFRISQPQTAANLFPDHPANPDGLPRCFFVGRIAWIAKGHCRSRQHY